MGSKKSYSPIIPLANRMVISPAIPEFKTDSGIVIPDQAKKPPDEGLCLAVGSEIKGVVPGDRVKFEKRTGNLIVLKGDSYLIIKEETVLGILTNQ